MAIPDISFTATEQSADFTFQGTVFVTGPAGPQGDPATNLVSSVAGKQGVVTLLSADISDLNTNLTDKLSKTQPNDVTGQSTFTLPQIFNNGVIIKNSTTGTYWRFFPAADDSGALDSEIFLVDGGTTPPGYGFPFGLMFGSTIISGSGVSGGGSGGSSFPFGLSLGVSLL